MWIVCGLCIFGTGGSACECAINIAPDIGNNTAQVSSKSVVTTETGLQCTLIVNVTTEIHKRYLNTWHNSNDHTELGLVSDLSAIQIL